MIATIQLSPYILIQGLVNRVLPSGEIAIAVSGREYIGRPVTTPQP